MNVPQSASNGMCIIIHANPVVAQDLSEILSGAGYSGNTEDLISSVSDKTAGEARLVVADLEIDALTSSPHGSDWLAQGVPIILLRGSPDTTASLPEGVHFLDQPFCTEHVVALLNRIRAA